MKKINVLSEKPYEVFIGGGLLNSLGEELRLRIKSKTLALLSDETVCALYAKQVETVLTQAGFSVLSHSFTGGEEHKTPQTVSSILEFLAQGGLTRSDTIVALGGGIVGDVAGFCAATYQRGCSLIQVPTTLLSAVDSSVGGKTGVNLQAGKNLMGAFWQPTFVLCDTDCLNSLPEEIFKDGVAEAIKYGVLEDPSLLRLLAAGDWNREEAVARCVSIKAQYVAQDERDYGMRQKLNLGHTFGHAIEWASGYAISHGRAVAVGMVMAARAAWRLGLAEESCLGEIENALRQNGLPVSTDVPADKLLMAMTRDKKRDGDSITLVLPQRVGSCVLKEVALGDLSALLAFAYGEG